MKIVECRNNNRSCFRKSVFGTVLQTKKKLQKTKNVLHAKKVNLTTMTKKRKKNKKLTKSEKLGCHQIAGYVISVVMIRTL